MKRRDFPLMFSERILWRVVSRKEASDIHECHPAEGMGMFKEGKLLINGRKNRIKAEHHCLK
jgi:hypothetical protein